MRLELEIEHLLRLTLAVYRVTALFPEEDLRHQIRESADKILADLLLNRLHPNHFVCSHITLSKQIKEIMGLFDEAEGKNWVDSRNFWVLRREYDKIRQAFNDVDHLVVHSEEVVENSPLKNNHRQKRILEAINENGKTKISELVRLFPGINRRTVLRDLEKLCQVGAVARNGNGRGICYTKK